MTCEISMPALFDTGPIAFAAIVITGIICLYKLRRARATLSRLKQGEKGGE